MEDTSSYLFNMQMNRPHPVCAVRLRPGLRHHDGRGQPYPLHVAQRELPADVHVAVATGKHLRRLQRKLLREQEVDDGQGRHQQGTRLNSNKNAYIDDPLEMNGRAAVEGNPIGS